jgi:hypothetical protein
MIKSKSVESQRTVDSLSLGLKVRNISPGTILTNSTKNIGSIAALGALYGNTDRLQQELQRPLFPSFIGNSTSNIPDKLHRLVAK